MSRDIYERRQLRPYRTEWTVRDRVFAGLLFMVVLAALVMFGKWIFESEHPALFSVIALFVCFAIYTVARYGTEEDDWPTYVAIWLFFDHD